MPGSETKTLQMSDLQGLIFNVARPGFEPRQSDPETDVLPLYYRAMMLYKRTKGRQSYNFPFILKIFASKKPGAIKIAGITSRIQYSRQIIIFYIVP